MRGLGSGPHVGSTPAAVIWPLLASGSYLESAVALALQQVGPAATQICPFAPCSVLSASLAPCPGAVLPTEHPQAQP